MVYDPFLYVTKFPLTSNRWVIGRKARKKAIEESNNSFKIIRDQIEADRKANAKAAAEEAERKAKAAAEEAERKAKAAAEEAERKAKAAAEEAERKAKAAAEEAERQARINEFIAEGRLNELFPEPRPRPRPRPRPKTTTPEFKKKLKAFSDANVYANSKAKAKPFVIRCWNCTRLKNRCSCDNTIKHTRSRRLICKHWNRGHCRLGENCKFKHPPQSFVNY